MKYSLYLTVISVVIFGCDPIEPPTSIYLENAKLVDEWLDHSMSLSEKHIWPDILDQSGKSSLTLSDGVSSKLIYYLELYNATSDKKYLDKGISAGEYIIKNLPQKSDSLDQKFWAFSPYGNVCGPAFALSELYLVTEGQQFKKAALHLIQMVDFYAKNKEDTVSWDLGNDVLGGLAGTGLFLLYATEKLEYKNGLNLAIKAGNTLLARAIKTDTTLNWKRGQNGRFILPNFSHGAAGIGYFLARLYEEAADEKFLEGAIKSSNYLESIANTDNDVFLVPYGFPDIGWDMPYDIGWAHGSAGVARLYFQLHKVTKEQKWKGLMLACYNSILSSGVPGRPNEGFGDSDFYLDNRFGIGSVADFVIYLHLNDPQQEYFEIAELLVKTVTEKAIIDSTGMYWPQERYNFMQNAGQETAFTGYFYGAVGYGLLMLKMHNLLLNKKSHIRLPDNPF